MKKLLVIISVFCFFQDVSALNIQQIVISQINTADINIYTKVVNGSRFENHSYESIINGNNITLNICFTLALNPIYTVRENNFLIPNINSTSGNYQVTVNVSYWTYINNIVVCNGVGGFDTETLTFTTPVNNAVYLSNNNFEFNNPELIFYPNPSKGEINIGKEKEITNVFLFDNLGRKIKSFTNIINDKIDLKDLLNGIYFIEFEYNGNRLNRKIILDK